MASSRSSCKAPFRRSGGPASGFRPSSSQCLRRCCLCPPSEGRVWLARGVLRAVSFAVSLVCRLCRFCLSFVACWSSVFAEPVFFLCLGSLLHLFASRVLPALAVRPLLFCISPFSLLPLSPPPVTPASAACSGCGAAGRRRCRGGGGGRPRNRRNCLRTRPPGCRPRRRGCGWRRGRETSGRG